MDGHCQASALCVSHRARTRCDGGHALRSISTIWFESTVQYLPVHAKLCGSSRARGARLRYCIIMAPKGEKKERADGFGTRSRSFSSRPFFSLPLLPPLPERKIPMLALVAAASTAWTPAARMCAPTLTPYRSDANFDYFRVPKELSVTLPKPLGAVLEEAAPSGVKVQELQEGGSGAETGLLKKGDKFVSVCGADCAALDFDSVMAMLVDAPGEVELQVVRTSIVRKPRAAVEPSLLTVDGKDSSVQKGVILRQAVVDTGAELYKGWMAKAQQCGGAGQCSTCWVNVVEGAENLSAMTEVEQRKGKKKPEGYRMSCQAIVQGDVKVEVP